MTQDRPLSIDWPPAYESSWQGHFQELLTGLFVWPEQETSRNLTPAFWFLVPLHQNSFTTILISTLAPTNFKTIDLGSNLVPLHQTKLPETLNVVLILVPLHQNKTSGNFEFGFNWFGALAPTQTSRNPSWFELVWCPCTKPKPFETFYWLRLTWCPCTKPRLLEPENWLNWFDALAPNQLNHSFHHYTKPVHMG